MMRKFLVGLLFAMFLTSVCATHYSAGTKIFMHRHSGRSKGAKGEGAVHRVPCFITADDAALHSLKAQGITVVKCADSLATALVPLHVLQQGMVQGVKHLSVAKNVQLCNDSARILSMWSPQLSPVLHSKYTGKGVVIGMIDTGFDFRHINFKDAEGRRRIAAVYLPTDTTGDAPVVGADTLPGSCFLGDAIDTLTTECTQLHGTHTMGTAAGSFKGNSYSGVAPEAELVVCGMDENDLTDVNIAHSLKFIFDYAEQRQKPCVVNMSLSSYAEAHDGTSQLCQLFDHLSGNGKIIIVSSGNDGNKDICFHQSLAGVTDTLSTCLSNRYYGYNLNGHLSMWGNSASPFAMRVQVVDRTSQQVLYESAWLSELPQDSVFSVSSATDAEFAKYFTGEWLFASAVEQNGKFHTDFVVDARYKNQNHVMRLQYVSATAAELRGWGSANMRFVDYGIAGCTKGDASMSISDLATADSVVSVGAYSSRRVAPVISGVNESMMKGSVPGEIAPYSSYGADMRGVLHPDVVAPGMVLVSSYSRFNQSMTTSDNWLTCTAQVDGEHYPYGINSGTSMSAPMVTGAIALALQAAPTLSTADVKSLLKQSSLRDAAVERDPTRWGCGKLDIHELLSIVDKTGNIYDINQDGEVNVSDVTALISHILGLAHYPHTDVNRDGVTNVSDVTFLIAHILAH
ncbi:MAG: S8 family serine peptidase [Bacteroidales bacterium]|nr:S8 family serine peptidase [Bacteroidales bacterium]